MNLEIIMITEITDSKGKIINVSSYFHILSLELYV